eukprot:TRINITY_DN11645_c0_g1_i1.p2 TRINITY_DN11645_c0_g1~~TRINITY_DN11645_c0_g1_i1.p2  ORF type:complete len:106 (-),score=60.47 TRINITY_DN11645_c0_g1_i1:102-419(-)
MSGAIKRLIPLADRILVRKVVPPKQTTSGIYLPETATKSSLREAEVIEVGPGRFDTESKQYIPIQVKKGDIVAVPEYGGIDLKVNDQEFSLFYESDLFGILKESV